MTSELWLRKDWAGNARNDANAVNGCKDALAQAGYVVDRLKAIVAEDTGSYWHYTIPVTKVAR